MLDFRGLGLEKWLVLELGPQLAGDGALATYSLPFEFRALEAILQHRVNTGSLVITLQFGASKQVVQVKCFVKGTFCHRLAAYHYVNLSSV